MEKHKKCKMCCSDAKWVWKGSYYCRVCLRAELEVFEQNIPHICEMCGDPLDDVYYADGENNPFCSVECALEYNDAEKLEEEEDDGGEEMNTIVRPPDCETKRYVIYIVRYVGHDSEAYTRECCIHDKESAIRIAEGYRKSGRRVAVCEETTTIKTLFTSEKEEK